MATITAVLITPLSGSLARYGQATAAAIRLWAERFARPDTVRLAVFDAHPDPVEAARRAERERPDLLFGPYGSGPMRKVAATTSRLVWNHSGAHGAHHEHVVPVLAPASTYFAGVLQAVCQADPGVRRACVVHRDTGFGRGVAQGAQESAVRLGLETDMVTLPAEPLAADLLLAAGNFADEVALARRALPGDWRAAAFVAAGVEEILAPLGSLREGLLGPAQWLLDAAPHPDEGPAAAEFAAAYRAAVHAEPPYPAAQAFAAALIAHRCLRDAGRRDDAAILAAARGLDCTTLFGRFALDAVSGRQIGHRVLTVQWQQGRRVVVWPPGQARAPVHLRPAP
jgi:branched-chain amino acid transport system substrate-binding protein